MLDECKGDKFYEVITLFSAAVLRKVLASRGGDSVRTAVARQLATPPTLLSQDQPSLLPLAIAHKVALTNLLRRKDAKRRKFLVFEATLDSKASDITKRIRRCTDTPRAKRPALAKREADAVKKQLADNWVGSQEWLGVVLHGDQIQSEHAFLSNRFDNVWHMVERGTDLAEAAPEVGLLEDLQSRVQEQHTRLQTWNKFYEEMCKARAQATITARKVSTLATESRFDSHTRHQLSSASKVEASKAQRPALSCAYLQILSDMDSELLRVSQANSQVVLTSLRQRRRSSSRSSLPLNSNRRLSIPKQPPRVLPTSTWHAEPKTLVAEPKTLVREQKALFEGLAAGNAMPPPQRHPSAKGSPMRSDVTLFGQSYDPSAAESIPLPNRSLVSQRIQSQMKPKPDPTPSSQHEDIVSSSPWPSERSPSLSQPMFGSETSSLEESLLERRILSLDVPDLRPEETLAEQIINAIGNATPSPVKKPQARMSMSLVDRTRITLSRTPSFEPVPESPDILPVVASTVTPTVGDEQVDSATTLLERTRISMAAMSDRPRTSTASCKDTTKKSTRTSRKSSFPMNQSNTPRNRKSFEVLEEAKSGLRTPQEDLLSGDIDYDRVFRSRPRIATSPIFSPEKCTSQNGDTDEAPYEEEITGIDLGDVDQSDDEDNDGFTQTMANSPSKRTGRMRY